MRNLQKEVMEKMDKEMSEQIIDCVRRKLTTNTGKKVLFVELELGAAGINNRTVFDDMEEFMNFCIENKEKIVQMGFDYAKNIEEFNENQYRTREVK